MTWRTLSISSYTEERHAPRLAMAVEAKILAPPLPKTEKPSKTQRRAAAAAAAAGAGGGEEGGDAGYLFEEGTDG